MQLNKYTNTKARPHLGVVGLDFFSHLKEPVLVNELLFIPVGVSLREAVGEESGDAS